MSVARLGLCLLAALVWFTAVGTATAAKPVVCGTPDRDGVPVQGALQLLKDPSTLTHRFGTDTSPQNLTLIFQVSGCALPRGQHQGPSTRVLSDDDAPASLDTYIDQNDSDGHDDIDAQRVGDSQFNVVVSVDPTRFKPGSYGAQAQVSADYLLAPSLTPVTVSRSESSPLWPVALGACGGLVGLALSLLTKTASGATVRTDGWRLAAVVVVAVGAGVVAGLAAYRDQDIWRLSENWQTTAGAGLTAATTGSAAAVLGLVAVDAVKTGQQRRRISRTSDPGGPGGDSRT